MSKKRRQHSPEFKAKVALAAIRGEETTQQIAIRFGIHPDLVRSWKRALLDGAMDIFDRGQKSQKEIQTKIDELYRQIGQLKVERDFLARKSGL